MKSVKYYVGAGCERPIQPVPRSVPAPRPPAPRYALLHRFSPTPAHRSAPLYAIFGSLRSVFAPLTLRSHALVPRYRYALTSLAQMDHWFRSRRESVALSSHSWVEQTMQHLGRHRSIIGDSTCIFDFPYVAQFRNQSNF